MTVNELIKELTNKRDLGLGDSLVFYDYGMDKPYEDISYIATDEDNNVLLTDY